MRVLVVGDFLKASGMTRYIFNVIGGIQADDLKIDVLSVSGSKECQKIVEQRGWGFNVIPPANGSLIGHLKGSYYFFKANAANYDIVHFNETALWNFLPILFAHWFGARKIVLNSHNTYFASDGNKLTLKILEQLHRLGKVIVNRVVSARIAVSREAAEWMFTKKTIRNHSFRVIANGINLVDFKFDENSRKRVRLSIGLDDNSHLYGNVGVLNKRKNQIRLLDIFKSISKHDPKSRLLLLGDGPLREDIEKKIVNLGLENNVIMLGNTGHVVDYYQAMDAIIMPSLNEGLSTVLLEAQTNGLTFFPSDRIPLGNYLKSLVYPISLDKTNEVWAMTIERVLDSQHGRSSRILEMRERGYDVQTAATEIYQIYGGCISG